ncbi:hypothetical protein D3C80_1171750 [compost metagenome]
MRLKTRNRYLGQLLLESAHGIAVFPHRLHVARGIQQCKLTDIRGCITRRQLGLQLLVQGCGIDTGWQRFNTCHNGCRGRLY